MPAGLSRSTLGSDMRKLIRLLVQNRSLFVFMLGMLAFRSAVADWNDVPTGSMQPTIRIGDRILVDRSAYDIRVPFTHISLYHRADPQRGDIVVLDSAAAHERLVKRVIGLPGDVVALHDNMLYVNGTRASYAPLQERGIADDTANPARYELESLGAMHHAVRLSLHAPSPASDYGPVTVPQGQYLLLGDDRDNSFDSRFLGFVPRAEIVGRSRYVALSLDPQHHYLPRSGRFGTALD